MKLDGVTGTRYISRPVPHADQDDGPVKLVNELMGAEKDGYKIEKNDRCCGESGTLAVTRPDISTQVRFRKEEEIRKGPRSCAASRSWPATRPGRLQRPPRPRTART